MIVIKNYHIQHLKNYKKIVNHDKPLCPDCNNLMTVRSSYPRMVTHKDGTKERYRLRLLFCAHCKALHAEIPDFMTAYKTYTTSAIRNAIQGISDGLTADDSTINRWKKQMEETHMICMVFNALLPYHHIFGGNRMKKKTIIIILVLLALCAIGAYVLLHHRPPRDQTELETDADAVQWQGNQELNHEQTDTKTIEIAGIASPLVFTANQQKQKVNFVNPSSNDCYIRFSLYANNDMIWQSGNVPPDSGYYEIELDEPIPSGEYDAYLLNECFRPDGTPLNNAQVQFKIVSQEENQ